jgi:hypothetical protein
MPSFPPPSTTDSYGLGPFLRLFEGYVDRYRAPTPDEQENIELKREHSLKVLEEASIIVEQSGLSHADRRLALLGALFHDAGRFPQYLTYGTFRDDASENHALLGLRTLRAMEVFSSLDPDERNTVHQAILLHNRRALPGMVRGRSRAICQVVRDADKLDILRVLLSHLEPNGRRNSVVTLGLARDPQAYTPSLIESIRLGRMARYEDMVWENDFVILLLSWIYDLNFHATRRMFTARGYLERLMALLPEGPPFSDLHGGLSRRLTSR